MTPTEMVEERKGALTTYIESPEWHEFNENTYQCRVLLCPEEGGGYSAHALRLPGVVSQGESVQEALVNITDAFQGAISVYQEEGVEIPWTDVDLDRPKGSVERWILVNV